MVLSSVSDPCKDFLSSLDAIVFAPFFLHQHILVQCLAHGVGTFPSSEDLERDETLTDLGFEMGRIIGLDGRLFASHSLIGASFPDSLQ